MARRHPRGHHAPAARAGSGPDGLEWLADLDREFLLTGQLGRVRFVTEDASGAIYVGNDSRQVLRVRPD